MMLIWMLFDAFGGAVLLVHVGCGALIIMLTRVICRMTVYYVHQEVLSSRGCVGWLVCYICDFLESPVFMKFDTVVQHLCQIPLNIERSRSKLLF